MRIAAPVLLVSLIYFFRFLVLISRRIQFRAPSQFPLPQFCIHISDDIDIAQHIEHKVTHEYRYIIIGLGSFDEKPANGGSSLRAAHSRKSTCSTLHTVCTVSHAHSAIRYIFYYSWLYLFANLFFLFSSKLVFVFFFSVVRVAFGEPYNEKTQCRVSRVRK